MTLFTMMLSFIGLLWAANHLVTGALGVAHHYRISPLVMGLTLVALGSSAPEIMIGISAALEGHNELALGNAIGANIANIGLVLSLTILLKPLTIKTDTILRREYPLLLMIMLFTYSMMLDGYLSIMDGCIFLVACIGLIIYLIYLARRFKNNAMNREFKQIIVVKRPMMTNLFNLFIGLTILRLGSYYLVQSATQIAQWLGMSNLVMGLTIVAIGTCLPNVATSMVAAFKGFDDIAVGNILGSNMFNLLMVMAFPGIINPSEISHKLLWRDIPTMFFITFVLLAISYYYKNKLSRWHGGLLLLIYCCYMTSLIYKTV